MKSVRLNWTQSEGPSATVIEAVASATDRDELELPPLHEYVDADALDAVVTSRQTEDSDGVSVSFDYADVEVVVDSRGWVEVQPFVTERG